MKRRWLQAAVWIGIIFVMLFGSSTLAAEAAEAQDITVLCTMKGKSKGTWTSLHDRKFTTHWTGIKADNPSIEIQIPGTYTCGSLYVCFYDIPKSWCVQAWREGDEWVTVAQGGTDYQHEYITFAPEKRIRLQVEGNKQVIKISELYVLSAGDAPDWVQRWQPSYDKADLLVLSAHPDDEIIYFGGTIPYYAAEVGKRVQVVFATMGNDTRRSEALNVLWMLGVRNYPMEGGFYDAYSGSLANAYKRWKKTDVENWFTGLVRKLKPEVIVTHDVNGEYGHGAHRLCADLAQHVFDLAADAESYPESAAEYGVWEVKKLYLHLYEENQLTMDWKKPMSVNPEMTPLLAAQEAFELYVTQKNSGKSVLKGKTFAVEDGGQFDNALFGLAKTRVGLDAAQTDFFENVDWFPDEATIAAAKAARAEKAAQEAADADADADAASTPTAAPTSTPAPDSSAAPTMSFSTPPPKNDALLKSVSISADTDEEAINAALAKAPALNARGFLDEGEYVYEDAALGLWVYRSTTLNITIQRKSIIKDKRVWYEAELYCDFEAGELPHSVPSDPENIGGNRQQPDLTATLNQCVFAMNSDYFAYRMNRSLPVGIIIRNQQIIFDKTIASNTKRFPNYDTMALYPDGSLQTNLSADFTAEEYIAKGAYDVFCFGPYLVKDGEINPMLAKWSLGQTNQPRCSFGMIEPGHYMAILEEGRLKNEAKGVSLSGLASMMQQKGCVEALNLDGGQTAAIMFMGKRITRVGPYNGGNTSPRSTSEVLALGTSALVAP